jgi:hypothetical protein
LPDHSGNEKKKTMAYNIEDERIDSIVMSLELECDEEHISTHTHTHRVEEINNLMVST